MFLNIAPTNIIGEIHIQLELNLQEYSHVLNLLLCSICTEREKFQLLQVKPI